MTRSRYSVSDFDLSGYQRAINLLDLNLYTFLAFFHYNLALPVHVRGPEH